MAIKKKANRSSRRNPRIHITGKEVNHAFSLHLDSLPKPLDVSPRWRKLLDVLLPGMYMAKSTDANKFAPVRLIISKRSVEHPDILTFVDQDENVVKSHCMDMLFGPIEELPNE